MPGSPNHEYNSLQLERRSIRDLLFERNASRPESAHVILGYHRDRIVRITLEDLRIIVGRLAESILEKGLSEGDTILLASFPSSTELANAILFVTFCVLGIHVFMPMFPQVSEFENWQKETGFRVVIMPGSECLCLEGHEREKEICRIFNEKSNSAGIGFFDAYLDFGIDELLGTLAVGDSLAPSSLPEKHTETEIILTTSGTSGKCKVVRFGESAFVSSCRAWEEMGLFHPSRCGNTGFTPLFTHSIGVRSLINAIWTGKPCCIITSDWFLTKPEIARYLMMQFEVGHIVGGPALFNVLLEFVRIFPELKSVLRQNLKMVISIGAEYSLGTAYKIKQALGLDLINAFGSTETLMVSINLPAPGKSYQERALGNALPGVDFRLRKNEDGDGFILLVRSEFGSKSGLISDGYFDTGDLVQKGQDGELLFVSRVVHDFIKDDFGVKVPLGELKLNYEFLDELTDHIHWTPLDHQPGLGALLFLKADQYSLQCSSIADRIKSRNQLLESEQEPFEYDHRHISRIALVRSPVPLNRKGLPSAAGIQDQFREILADLKNPFVDQQEICSTVGEKESDFRRFSDTRQGAMLAGLGFDIDFVRGEKDYLYYFNAGKEIKVLDLVGGFGSGLHGHNHPAIREAMEGFLASEKPSLNSQGSNSYFPGRLAARLNRLYSQNTGKTFKVLFANSGSEAVELALHHAYFEWVRKAEKFRDEQFRMFGSQAGADLTRLWEENLEKLRDAPATVLVVNDCYHGTTSAPRSLVGNKERRAYFKGLLKPRPEFLDDRDPGCLQTAMELIESIGIELNVAVLENGLVTVKPRRFSTIIASLVEPVRGEGGIRELNPELARILSMQEFPLISDEIQCGLGRSGELPTWKDASYYLLGKSLGGGYEKISAVLIDDRRFEQLFTKYYSSTFAYGEMAAAAACKAVELVEQGDFPRIASEKGRQLGQILEQIASDYPDVISSVQGRGLMYGIQFDTKTIGQANPFLRILAETEMLGYFLSGWLFHEENIRVLPTLSRPDSIRIEPSVFLGDLDLLHISKAFSRLCSLVRSRKNGALSGYLMNGDPYLDKMGRVFDAPFPISLEPEGPAAVKVAFIGNFTSPPAELSLLCPELCTASDTGLRILFNKVQLLFEGKAMRLLSQNIMRGRVHLSFYNIPFDTATLETAHRYGKKKFFIRKIQEAVSHASSNGAEYIGLGAHVSILSGNGLFLAEREGCRVITGNTLTVASCLFHLDRQLEKMHLKGVQVCRIIVVGANGNIGSGLVKCLADEKYQGSVILMLSNNLNKLIRLKQQVFLNATRVHCSVDLLDLRTADIIISCTNTNDPIILPQHLGRDRETFLIDLAVPASVALEVRSMPNVEFCDQASSVFMPDDPEFKISSHTPAGKVFCCAAEVMLAAINKTELPLKGRIRTEAIQQMLEWGKKEHIFEKGTNETAI